ncbi:MAG: hypothetical protein DRN05_05595 [Thermoplasmata archaeon]|nr:MAG: hypothetical protein DRN05_05595 [Thermoplasmata archaeon]
MKKTYFHKKTKVDEFVEQIEKKRFKRLKKAKPLIILILLILLIPLIKADSIRVSSHFTEREIPRGIKVEIGYLIVTNTSDMSTTIFLNSYEGFPDPHWINFSENNFILSPEESKKIIIYAGVPPDFTLDTFNIKIEVVGKFKNHNVAVLPQTTIKILETSLTLEKYRALENENKNLEQTIKEKDSTIQELRNKNTTQRKIIYGMCAVIGILIVLLLLLIRANIKLNHFIDEELP